MHHTDGRREKQRRAAAWGFSNVNFPWILHGVTIKPAAFLKLEVKTRD